MRKLRPSGSKHLSKITEFSPIAGPGSSRKQRLKQGVKDKQQQRGGKQAKEENGPTQSRVQHSGQGTPETQWTGTQTQRCRKGWFLGALALVITEAEKSHKRLPDAGEPTR